MTFMALTEYKQVNHDTKERMVTLMKKSIILISCAMICASVAYSAEDILPLVRNSSGTMTSGFDSYGNVVAPTGTFTTVIGAGSGITGVALDTEVWGEAGITESTNDLVNTVTIQAKDIAGNNLSDYRVLRVWMSETDMGAASTNNIESLSLAGGTAIETKTADADYIYLSSSIGCATGTVTATAAGTNYMMVLDGSVINSAALTFE